MLPWNEKSLIVKPISRHSPQPQRGSNKEAFEYTLEINNAPEGLLIADWVDFPGECFDSSEEASCARASHSDSTRFQDMLDLVRNSLPNAEIYYCSPEDIATREIKRFGCSFCHTPIRYYIYYREQLTEEEACADACSSSSSSNSTSSAAASSSSSWYGAPNSSTTSSISRYLPSPSSSSYSSSSSYFYPSSSSGVYASSTSAIF